MKGLSPQLGLITLIQFGGMSSKPGKRSSAEPFCYGLGQLYRDPQYQSWQLRDFELIHSFQENRGDLKKIYIQALMAEAVLDSHGAGGDSTAIFQLLQDCLSQLEKAETPQHSDRVLIFYILRFLGMMGMQEFYQSCGICGRLLNREEPLFTGNRGIHSCPGCADRNSLPLYPGARVFLDRLDREGMKDLHRVSLSPTLQQSLKEWMLLILQNSLGHSLKTIKSGAGIL